MSLVSPGGSGDTAWLVDISDSLVISGASSQASEKLTCNFRFIQVDQTGCFGTIWADSRVLDLSAGDRSVKSVQYNFDSQFFNGPNSQTYLSDVSIESAVATTRGQSFARVNLYRKSNNAKSTKCAILSDYVTQQVTACLRNSRHFTSIEDLGWTYPAQPTFPFGSHGEARFTVPTNARWKIRGGTVSFQTSATAGTRIPSIAVSTVLPGSGFFQVFNLIAKGTIGPNLTAILQISNATWDTFVSAPQSYFTFPFPDEFLLSPTSIVDCFGTNGTDDTWQVTSLLVEEWIDNV